MAFKKITPPPIKEKVRSKPMLVIVNKDYRPKEKVTTLMEMAEIQPTLHPNIVKWDNPGSQATHIDGTFVKGHVWTLDGYDPFGVNEFIIFFNHDQTEYARSSGLLRVYPLNQDLSPQLNFKGEAFTTIINKWRLFQHVCGAIGPLEL